MTMPKDVTGSDNTPGPVLGADKGGRSAQRGGAGCRQEARGLAGAASSARNTGYTCLQKRTAARPEVKSSNSCVARPLQVAPEQLVQARQQGSTFEG
jgi:hypothetical protein